MRFSSYFHNLCALCILCSLRFTYERFTSSSRIAGWELSKPLASLWINCVLAKVRHQFILWVPYPTFPAPNECLRDVYTMFTPYFDFKVNQVQVGDEFVKIDDLAMVLRSTPFLLELEDNVIEFIQTFPLSISSFTKASYHIPADFPSRELTVPLVHVTLK